MGYDQNNIFAKILRGEIPAVKIYEDEDTFAFMDVMPQTEGHALVIPKSPSEMLIEADPADLIPLIKTVQIIAKAAMTAFDADGVTIQQFNHPAAGQTVFHTHFHILPRYEGVSLRPHSGVMGDMEIISAHGEKYRTALTSA